MRGLFDAAGKQPAHVLTDLMLFRDWVQQVPAMDTVHHFSHYAGAWATVVRLESAWLHASGQVQPVEPGGYGISELDLYTVSGVDAEEASKVLGMTAARVRLARQAVGRHPDDERPVVLNRRAGRETKPDRNDEIRRLWNGGKGHRQADLARKFGVSQPRISEICAAD